MEKSLLRVENLHKTFATGQQILNILQGITATFKQGSSYAIIGSSGSGKSTLMHLLAGLDKPTVGSVFFNDTDITQLNPTKKDVFLQQSVGLVFQLPYLIKELSVLENIMVRGLIMGLDTEECNARALELLDAVCIADKALSNPLSLSGGQQQRVALARALFSKPAFLIADEPTGSLDVYTAQGIVQLVLKCQKEWGMGVIVSTHDAFVAQSMETVYQLNNGTLTLKNV
ncbi:MAG TPA: ABC transporter ATP-binding protein [Candidatus Dependentiae bacterium]|jgi:ABC-type lipoprotein export system ATPase subunit|nr:ABC transporter ATP-binding protein [Candidatus Dependentiae bacterium]